MRAGTIGASTKNARASCRRLLARYCFVLLGGGSGGSQAELSGPEANASIRAAITKSDSCNPPIFRVVNDTSQKPHPSASSG